MTFPRPRRLTPLALLVVALLLPAPAQAAEGEMRWGLHVTLAPKWLDPAETEAFSTPFMVLYAVHDALVKPMPGGLNTLSLAESWQESKDHLTYTFTLRKNVRFHNGEPVTAEDVKFSFERYKGASATLLKEKVKDVQVLGSTQVRFVLKEPWGDRPVEGEVPHHRHAAGGVVMTANDPERHYPGVYYSCDARNAEGDRRLCPIHEQAPTALKRILAILEDDDLAPAAMLAEIRTLALRALGA